MAAASFETLIPNYPAHQNLSFSSAQAEYEPIFARYGYDPQVILRDKWLSVRGKPAESVLAAWYPKLTGR